MKTQRSTKKFAKVSLVLSAALLIIAATAAPAFAEDQLQVVEMILDLQLVEEQIADGGAFEAVEPPVIGDAGDWEMVPADPNPVIPDGGDWEPGPDDEPQLPEGGEDEGGQETTETPVPEGGNDEPTDEPEGEEDTPESQTPTETPEPEEPNDEPYLPFTGGNGAPYALAGIALAVAGAGYLIRKRYVFDQN